MSGHDGHRVLKLDEVEALPVLGGELQWLPVRRILGLGAFGMNAYRADAGALIVEDHTEETLGHEEVYVVLRGRASFSLDEHSHELDAGSLVFCEPGTRRSAVALEDGTLVLAVGGKPGAAYEPSLWEECFYAVGQQASGDPEGARATIVAALAAHPDDANVLYDAACIAALAGRDAEATALLGRAVAIKPKVADWAQGDSDLDSLRSRADWPL